MQVGQKKRPWIKRMTAKRRMSTAEAEHPLGVLDTSSLPKPSSGAGAAAGHGLGCCAR